MKITQPASTFFYSTVFLIFIFCSANNAQTEGVWIKADFHTHTTMSDGDHSPDEVVIPAITKYDLDFIALSEHGGLWYRVNKEFQRIDDKGNVLFDGKEYIPIRDSEASKHKNLSRTIQIKENSFPEVLEFRKKYPNKLILQGLEWNIPGHDHGSIGIIADDADAICNFHYIYDRNDIGYIDSSNLTKHSENLHANALLAIKYLDENYGDKAYFMVNHPSRKLAFKVEDFRDFHNASPNISIGFEAIPGHQKSPGKRCEYQVIPGDSIKYDSRTFGGADYMLAKVGGLWDAMLGEGRKFWVFTNSDYHRTFSDFYPGEYAVNYIYSEGNSYEDVVKGMKSGNVYIVQNKLITSLDFAVSSNSKSATMGQTLKVDKNSKITVTIKFVSPDREQFGKSLSIDHIDLICGDVTGLIEPASENYSNPTNTAARIEKQFNKDDFAVSGDWQIITYEMTVDKPIYLRLRGTNNPVNTPNETDSLGNPLDDNLVGDNSEEKALTDIWFYSNPIFIEINE